MPTLAKFLLVFFFQFFYYFALEGLSVYLLSLIWKFYYKNSLIFKSLHIPSPCSVGKLALYGHFTQPLGKLITRFKTEKVKIIAKCETTNYSITTEINMKTQDNLQLSDVQFHQK